MKFGTNINSLFGVLLLTQLAYADALSTGPNGINSAGLQVAGQPLIGTGVAIGQVEVERPAQPTNLDDADHSNSDVKPKAVFIENDVVAPTPNSDVEIINGRLNIAHATQVASAIISTNVLTTGVAPGADLYSAMGKANPNSVGGPSPPGNPSWSSAQNSPWQLST